MLYENTAFYIPDFAAEIDTEEEILADELGITPRQARVVMKKIQEAVTRNESLTLARAIGLMLQSSNLPVTVHAMAIAAGLDQLNGKRSQSEIAKELGCTRALISHYVVGIRDILSGKDSEFDCFKFRKSQASRSTFKAKATDPFTAAKAAAKQRHQKNNVKSFLIISTDGRRFIIQAADKQAAISQAKTDRIDIESISLA